MFARTNVEQEGPFKKSRSTAQLNPSFALLQVQMFMIVKLQMRKISNRRATCNVRSDHA